MIDKENQIASFVTVWYDSFNSMEKSIAESWCGDYHTYGIGYDSKPADHLGAKDFIEHVQRFRKSGLLKENGEVLQPISPMKALLNTPHLMVMPENMAFA